MTVVAWDGKMLAADRQGNWGGTKIAVCKIRRVVTVEGPTALVGCAGYVAYLERFIDWLEGRIEAFEIPKDCDFSALVVYEDGNVELYDTTLIPIKTPSVPVAIGSGRGEALGAMLMGASAKLAVKIASIVEVDVGMGVDVLTFDGEPRPEADGPTVGMFDVRSVMH